MCLYTIEVQLSDIIDCQVKNDVEAKVLSMVAIGEQKIKIREMNTVKVQPNIGMSLENQSLFVTGHNGGCESSTG